MSSFHCEKCGAPILDSPDGYYTECEHYPITTEKERRMVEEYNRMVKGNKDVRSE